MTRFASVTAKTSRSTGPPCPPSGLRIFRAELSRPHSVIRCPPSRHRPGRFEAPYAWHHDGFPPDPPHAPRARGQGLLSRRNRLPPPGPFHRAHLLRRVLSPRSPPRFRADQTRPATRRSRRLHDVELY